MKKKKLLSLDLHGLTQIEAEIKLEEFFLGLKKYNTDKVKIISGWGREKEPILFSLVQKWLLDRAYSFSNDLGSFTINLGDGERRKIMS
jgi:DNA-nicking Smr family endonuclease